MNTARKFLSGIVALTMVISLSACGSSSKSTTDSTVKEATAATTKTEATVVKKDPIKLKVMLLSEDENRIKLHKDYYAPNVTKDLPDFNVEFELPGKAYQDKLKIYNASGELPDVFWGQTPIAIDSGNALDLTPYITQDGFLDKYKNKSAVMPYKDGKFYAISSGTDAYFTASVYYHKDIFAKAGVSVPTNFDEFVKVCTTLQAKGYVPMSIVTWAVQNWLFQDLAMSANPQDVEDLKAGKLKLTDKPFVDAADKIRKLVDIKAFPKDVAMIEHQQHVDLFNQNKAAMLYHPLWVVGSIQDNKDLDWFYLSSFSKTPATIHYWGAANNGFNVAKNTKNPEAAVKLAEWLTMEDGKFFTEVAKNAVALAGFDAPSDMNPIVKAYYDMMNDSNIKKVTNFTTNYFNEATTAELGTNAGKLLTGQESGADFCKALEIAYEKK